MQTNQRWDPEGLSQSAPSDEDNWTGSANDADPPWQLSITSNDHCDKGHKAKDPLQREWKRIYKRRPLDEPRPGNGHCLLLLSHLLFAWYLRLFIHQISWRSRFCIVWKGYGNVPTWHLDKLTTVKTKMTALAFTLIWLLYCAAVPFRDLSSKCGDTDGKENKQITAKRAGKASH